MELPEAVKKAITREEPERAFFFEIKKESPYTIPSAEPLRIAIMLERRLLSYRINFLKTFMFPVKTNNRL